MLLGLWVIAALGLGVGYLFYGWKRLDTLPAPADVHLSAPFRHYADHGAVLEGADWPYLLRIDPARGGGALLFFGSGHTKDPHDPQIDGIITQWDAFHPTLALCESRLGLYIGGLLKGVSMFGEVGAAFALARRDDVPVYSLEQAWPDEIGAMLRAFEPRQVAAFYAVRGIQGERGDRSGKALDDLAASLLKKRVALPGLEGTFATFDAFDAWWQTELGTEVGDWRTMPEQAMWPGVKDETLLTRMANASNRTRDEHMARVIIDRVRGGERVFVVCGGSHALTLEPALRAALDSSSREGPE